MKILIKGGRVVDPKNDFDKVADVLVDNGVISEIGENINANGDVTVIDAEGKIVSPGLVDMHSHLRDPGQEYKEDILVGYRWYDTKKVQPLFPFGHGMSYTTFEYGKPVMSAKTMNADGSIDILVKVKNTGKVIGKEIVQLYIGDEECSVLRPVKELKDFRKVQLLPNEEKEVRFTIKPEVLKFFDDKQHTWIVEPGKFKAYIAASSADIRGTVTFEYTQL